MLKNCRICFRSHYNLSIHVPCNAVNPLCKFQYFNNNVYCNKDQEKHFTDSPEVIQRLRVLVELVVSQFWTGSNGKGKCQKDHLQ